MTATPFGSMVQLLQHRAAARPRDRAYVFLADRGGEARTLTFGELDRRARAIAARLVHLTQPGDRGVLLFPPGLEFIEAFFGCLYAGVIAVPAVPPRRERLRDATFGIIDDCRPRVALTTSAHLPRLRAGVEARFGEASLAWLAVDGLADAEAPLSAPRHHDVVFLQYTSGSTSAPKGVVVGHDNLLANLEMARDAFGTTQASTYVSWVPLHHDMGLILNVLASVYAGACCVLLAPVTFMQRPLTWLRAIHDYRADVAGGPNFAFDHCVRQFRADRASGLDLSCWQVAFNGAEPVHADTIARFTDTYAPHGFAARAVYPCYGMAEATVLLSARHRAEGPLTRLVDRAALQAHRIAAPRAPAEARPVVGCGRALPGEEIAIVRPETSVRADPDEVGEIWARGPHVARGYWGKAAETAAVFQAHLAGDQQTCWLRTGDLGWRDAGGELYITGRIKDCIIIRGTNFYPQDIERTVGASHPALRLHAGAAFAVEDAQGEELLVVVHELEPGTGQAADLDAIAGAIRAAVVREHELTIYRVVLVRAGTIPTTSSGKIQRRLTRQRWYDGSLDVVDAPPATSISDAVKAVS